MMGKLMKQLRDFAYGPRNVNAEQLDREIHRLSHRLASEAAGLKRATRIAARSALVVEMIAHGRSDDPR